jgi:hypothetical protein
VIGLPTTFFSEYINMANEILRCYKLQIEKEVLSEMCSIPDILAVLREMKAMGVSQKEAYTILEEIRVEVVTNQNDGKEDTILGLMDIVTRYCIPQHYIW